MTTLRSFSAAVAAAILCLVSADAPAQRIFEYPVTAPDVAPGVDHGNSDAKLPDEFKKQLVFYRSQQPPGTIIVETKERHLYLIRDETHAIRYGIGVGRDGFTWQGMLQIARKAEWPDWHPPATRSAHAPCISALPCTASTAPTRRRPSVRRCRRAASVWSTTTWPTSMTASASARALSSGRTKTLRRRDNDALCH